VQAIAPGEVERVVNSPRRGFSGYGRSVVVRLGDGVRVLYAHLGSISAVVGQWLATGDTLGTVGADCGTVENPGKRCKGAHVHVELASRAYPQRTSESDRIDPRSYRAMPAPELARDSLERWRVLDGLINRLYQSIPADRRKGEPETMLAQWREAYEAAPRWGAALRVSALSDWVVNYNDARDKLAAAGLTVPERARDRNELAEDIDRNIIQPAADLASGAVTWLVLGGVLWLWLESKKNEQVIHIEMERSQ
jgi:hypothetical protein